MATPGRPAPMAPLAPTTSMARPTTPPMPPPRSNRGKASALPALPGTTRRLLKDHTSYSWMILVLVCIRNQQKLGSQGL